MKKYLTLIIVLFTVYPVLLSQNAFQAYTRQGYTLNGKWNIIVDPYDNGYYNYRYEPFDALNYSNTNAYYYDSKAVAPHELVEYDFDKSQTLTVPGDWNTQDSSLFFYESTVWYRNIFPLPENTTGKRVFLYIGAANYHSDVYVNGKKAGIHTGGFTPFHFEITSLLQDGENSLVIRVNNHRLREGVPTLMTDWWNYGGITRDVKILVVPEVFIRDYHISLLSYENNEVAGYVMLDGAGKGEKVTIKLDELKIQVKTQTDENGRADFKFQSSALKPWSPEDPKLYSFSILTAADAFQDTVGFRTITAQDKNILLNGEPVFLRGISIHEEYAVDGGGRVNNRSEAQQLLEWAKELNCNFVRLAHYPHNEHMVRLADRMGIMVWSEVPVYWTIDWEDESAYENAEQQLTEMINRDKNRASVIIWSLANETPVSEARNTFLKRLAVHARKLDSSRLISAAMEKRFNPADPNMAVVQDPLAEVLDIVSFNEYIGWYEGLPDKCDKITWEIPYNKPVIISEFGGGAKQGYHGNSSIRWTEEFQEELYLKTLKMADKIEGLCGMSPWILVDFRSPRRPLPEIQDFFNRKGLISESGKKKKAFHVLATYYKNKMTY